MVSHLFLFMCHVGTEADHKITYPGRKKFSNEDRKGIKGNLICFIRNNKVKVERNFDFFMAGKSEGLTQAGMGRLNQSNEAFVYCILGAQVTIRSSILGSSGSATEVQHEFLILVEDPIRTPEISTSVQRFQLATDEAKVGLDLALSPCTWLMSSNLLLNTQSMVGYKNNLKKAIAEIVHIPWGRNKLDPGLHAVPGLMLTDIYLTFYLPFCSFLRCSYCFATRPSARRGLHPYQAAFFMIFLPLSTCLSAHHPQLLCCDKKARHYADRQYQQPHTTIKIWIFSSSR